MARGKKNLASEVDESEIIISDEVLNPPNILINDDFGISTGTCDYALVERKVAHRTGKEEDGKNCGKVIRYTRWDDVNYGRTPFKCLENYFEYANLTKTKQLKMEKDFNKIADIYKETQNEVVTFMRQLDLSKQTVETGTLMDEIYEMKDKLRQINKVLEEADELHELIKDKRRIIINDTEPKKHRVKLEE